MTKTNAIRMLESKGVPFRALGYTYDPEDSGAVVAARKLGVDPDQVFKTLVTVGAHAGEHVVFCIPAASTLDRKKAAAACGQRSVNLVPVKGLFAATGYVRGGCSPVGMKRPYPVYLDEIATAHDWILINAGARGLLLQVPPTLLADAVGARFADLVS